MEEKTPRELNWVDVRAACTIERMFEQLCKAVEEDVKQANRVCKLPADRQFVVEVDGEGRSFVVKYEGTIAPRVHFTIKGDQIIVTGSTVGMAPQQFGFILSNEGRCKLTEHGEEREQWQVRKSALEGLFFPASI